MKRILKSFQILKGSGREKGNCFVFAYKGIFDQIVGSHRQLERKSFLKHEKAKH